MYHDQRCFIQQVKEWLDIRKFIKVIPHINRLKKKKTHYFLNDFTKKIFDKIQHPIVIKTLSKQEIESYYSWLEKGVNQDPQQMSYFMLKHKFSLYMRNETCLLSLLLFTVVLDILTRAVKQEKWKFKYHIHIYIKINIYVIYNFIFRLIYIKTSIQSFLWSNSDPKYF